MKVRLIAYRKKMNPSGVLSDGNYAVDTSSNVTVTVQGASATSRFSVDDILYTKDGIKYGQIKEILSSTSIKLHRLRVILSDNDELYLAKEFNFELELLKEPNISLNYQFADVKEPDKRKGSFSQTFKLPFTDNNNQFFQNWYNVNLQDPNTGLSETIFFSSKEEYDASIYVGTVSQFEGVIQLRAVYQKAKYYEVVLFSKISSLFSIIGDETIRDAFNGNTSLNHVFNETQMKASWNGSGSTFVNASSPAVSLKDPDYNIQKVMYPLSVTKPDFYYNPVNYNEKYLFKDTIDPVDPGQYITDITQFRPAIQLKEVIKVILGKAGLSYTSAFIDSEYFSKIFMTTGGHLEGSPVPIVDNSEVVVAPGQVIVGYSEDTTWGELDASAGWGSSCDNNNQFQVSVNPNTIIENSSTCYNTNNNYFKKKHPTQNLFTMKHKTQRDHVQTCPNCSMFDDCWGYTFKIELVRVKITGAIYTNPITGMETIYGQSVEEMTGTNQFLATEWFTHNINISDVPVGERFTVRATAYNWKRYSSDSKIVLGKDCSGGCGEFSAPVTCAGGWDFGDPTQPVDCLSTKITMNYDGYNLENYGATIDVPACIDPELKQKDFFKDLIQRFNLIVNTNPNDPSNVIIEPYDTYLASGTIRYWTDKLDLSKDIKVSDTSSLQKEHIHFSDKEDNDLYNKEIKEQHPDLNVYGNVEITETNNKWAKGELTNTPMFSPYINGKVIPTSGSQGGYQTTNVYDTFLHNLAVQYEFSYSANDDDEVEIENAKTNPKLFWYSGATTDIRNAQGDAKTIYMHGYDNTGWSVFSFTNYPLCSPYELTTNVSEDTAYIGPTTRSLYWDSWATPLVPELTVFNWTESTPTNWGYCLYGYYWYSYLQSLHHPDSRLMEAYINLNEVDIFSFDFNDEIFIKDSYWRILKIHNYQVGVKTSSKVTLIKVVDTFIGSNCGYSISDSGLYNDLYLKWCPNDDTDCSTPTIFVPQDCCYSRGGTPDPSLEAAAIGNGFTNGELPCKAYQGSLPISKRILTSNKNIRSLNGLKSIGQIPLSSPVNNFSIGSGKTKTNNLIMTPIKDDLSIKYETETGDRVKVMGESHRIVLVGQTVGNTTAYAYPRGSSQFPSISLPDSSNIVIKVKAINTVVGGTSTTYPVGTTEAFGYHTAFKMINGVGTQIGAAGGVQDFAIADGTVRGSIAITLDTTSTRENKILFGLLNGQADTVRVWSLTVDFSVQLIPSIATPLDTNWALYQNSETIHLQDKHSLLWN